MTIPPVPADQRSAEPMKTDRASAQKRRQQRCALLHDRHQLGLAVAKQAAALLKQEFKAEKSFCLVRCFRLLTFMSARMWI